MELRQFGIKVSLIEPGDFKTEINDNRTFSGAASDGIGDYHDHFAKTKTIIARDEREGADVMQLACLFLAARRGELFRLKVQDLDFENDKVRLWTKKREDGNWEYDWLPMATKLRE